MKIAKKTAAIYCRVSTGKQAEAELPIDSQIDRCKAKAAALEADVVHVFVDGGKTGRSALRDDFQAAIHYCEMQTPDYLVTWSTSRFARNQLDAILYKQRLERAGVDLVYVSIDIDRTTTTGWMMEGILEVFDEWTSRTIGADTRRSMAKAAADGFWTGGRAPYGYQSAPAPQNPRRRVLTPHPEEANNVQRVFELRLGGSGSQVIADTLAAEDRTNRGRRWYRASVLSLLKNEAIAGRIVFGRRARIGGSMRLQPRESWLVVPAHEPIIDPEKFDAVQDLIAAASSKSAGAHNSKHRFTGLVVCGCCGSALHIESAKGRSRRYSYYRCWLGKSGECDARRIRADEFEEWLAMQVCGEMLTERSLSATTRAANRDIKTLNSGAAGDLAAVDKAIAGIKSKNNNLFDILEMHGRAAPNLADLTERLQGNKARIEKLQARRAALMNNRRAAPMPQMAWRDVAEMMRKMITTGDPVKARALLSEVIEEIAVKPGAVRVKYAPARLVQYVMNAVHSNEKWLPETVLLGTVCVNFTPPPGLVQVG